MDYGTFVTNLDKVLTTALNNDGRGYAVTGKIFAVRHTLKEKHLPTYIHTFFDVEFVRGSVTGKTTLVLNEDTGKLLILADMFCGFAEDGEIYEWREVKYCESNTRKEQKHFKWVRSQKEGSHIVKYSAEGCVCEIVVNKSTRGDVRIVNKQTGAIGYSNNVQNAKKCLEEKYL